MPHVGDPRILVDAAARDDAAVFRLSEDRALVATVDFFTPIVDDPYAFGAIAAANALSDLYAMGATPLVTLNLVAWPRAPEMLELLGHTLRGGADVVARAGAFVLGGHSIDDPEPKYGMVAIGEAAPERLTTNRGARAGDTLLLTKPIGTGILSTALKRDLITEPEMREAIEIMIALNAGAAEEIRVLGDAVHAVTDLTGYGLLGHLHNLLAASGCGARLRADAVPEFSGVRDLAARGAIAGGTERNLDAAAPYTRWPTELSRPRRVVLADAQTSGGLLIAVAAGRAGELVERLAARDDVPVAAVIGDITDGPAGTIEVTAGGAAA